ECFRTFHRASGIVPSKGAGREKGVLPPTKHGRTGPKCEILGSRSVEADQARHPLGKEPPLGDYAKGFPARIGPYDLVGELGEGGVGVVFRARHHQTGALVALKTVRVRATAHLSSVRREILALH